MNVAHLILFLASLVIIGVGLLGLITPSLPGMTLIWAGLFLYGGITRFEVLDLEFFLLASLIVIVTFFLDYASTVWKTRAIGGERWALLGAIAGALIGVLLQSWVLMILLAAVFAFTSQLLFGKMYLYTVELSRMTIIGIVSGTLLRIVAGVALLALFIWKVAVGTTLF